MQRQPRYFKDDKEVTAQQALRDGVLQSGFSIRVPAFFKDAASFTDARQFWDRNRAALLVTDSRRIGGSEGNKPGFRVLDAPVNRQAINDARAAYLDDLQSAWRQDAEVEEEDDDGDRTECPACEGSGYDANGKACRKCGGTGEIPDDDDADEAAESQSDAKRRRRPEPDDDDRPPFGAQDRRTVDEMNATHQRNMAKIHHAYAQEISQAYRRGK